MALFPFLLSAAAFARPVSYADGWMIMPMNDGSENSLQISYSPTAFYSLGLRSDYRRDKKYWLHSLQYNRLLKRWNAPDSQGNLFLLSGAGVGDDHGDTEPALWGGVEADWETRRIYFSYENRLIHAGGIEKSFSHKARAGVAPYIADYDDLHTWLMVQLAHYPGEKETLEVTPFVRLFNQTALAEVGISHKGNVMLNVTLQF